MVDAGGRSALVRPADLAGLGLEGVRLVDVKGDTTVSVVLPALNEQETVGAIVAAIRAGLMERHGLVDELVVMDSGSTDGTYDVAVQAGAKVVRRDEVLRRVRAAARARARCSGGRWPRPPATSSSSSTPTCATSPPTSSPGCSARC